MHLLSDAKPVTKALFSMQSCRPRCNKWEGACAFSFSINPADHLCFDTLLQYIFVLFSMIEKIGDCCSVISAVFFHLHCFPMISYRKHTDKDGHEVL